MARLRDYAGETPRQEELDSKKAKKEATGIRQAQVKKKDTFT